MFLSSTVTLAVLLAVLPQSSTSAALPSLLNETLSVSTKRDGLTYHYRWYQAYDCNHDDAPETMYPPGDQDPLVGSLNTCYSCPPGANWDRVETDNDFSSYSGNPGGLKTYCDGNCGGGISNFQNTYCSAPPTDCAVGSFKVQPCDCDLYDECIHTCLEQGGGGRVVGSCKSSCLVDTACANTMCAPYG